ncbi:hypothetical protein ACTI_43960 [Actinoplanes sp. OR16]|nr:hypothetical protein ACTI_43960 [Actinoplanes sp. OR16]
MSPLLVELGEASPEPAGVVPGQRMGCGVQDAAEFWRVGAALEDAAATCGVDESVGRIAEKQAPGIQRLTRGTRP